MAMRMKWQKSAWLLKKKKATDPHGFDDALLKLFHLICHFISPVLLSQHLIRKKYMFLSYRSVVIYQIVLMKKCWSDDDVN